MDGTGRELAPGLHRIEAPLGERFVACYLIRGDEAAVLYDTGVAGTPAGSILPYCYGAGIDPASIRWVVISHCDVDHMGGDAAIKDLLPNVWLLAHRADRRLIEDVDAIIEERYREFRDDHGIDIDASVIEWCRSAAQAAPVDIAIDGPTTLDLGGRTVSILHTPGHSEGSISLWDPASGAALTSDAILGDGLHLADGREAFPPTYRNPGPYVETIAAVESLRPRWLLTAHEPVMVSADAVAFLDRSRGFATRLEAEVLEVLDGADGGRSTMAMIERLAPRMGAWDPSAWMFLANELVGHLEELSARGLVIQEPGSPVRWRTAAIETG